MVAATVVVAARVAVKAVKEKGRVQVAHHPFLKKANILLQAIRYAKLKSSMENVRLEISVECDTLTI